MKARCIVGALMLWIVFSSHLQAHDIAAGGGYLAGLTHPVLGFDHLLAMLSVGIISAQIGGRAIWTIPTTFVLVMIVGGALGMYGVPVPLVETGIALSVLALGTAICANKHAPLFLSMVAVAVFAIFHGHAHGTEMPHIANPWLYALGFVSGTAVIHIAGVLVGLIAHWTPSGSAILRYGGAAIAGIGFHILLGG